MKSKLIVVILIVPLTLLVPGCLSLLDSNSPWNVAVYAVEENQGENSYNITVKVVLQGQWNDEIVRDVRVCAENDEGDMIDSVDIGRLSSQRLSANATLRTNYTPDKIVLGYGEIDTDQPTYSIIGINLSKDGIYREFRQDGPRCETA